MNVEQFATELKVAPALLVEQLKAAGVAVGGAGDELSDQDKSRLLDYLRGKHGGAQPKSKITLTRKQTSEIKTADGAGRTRTVQVEVRKKRTLIKREIGPDTPAQEKPAEVVEPAEVAQPAPIPEPVVEAPPVVAPAPAPEPTPEPEVVAEAAPVEVIEPEPVAEAPAEPVQEAAEAEPEIKEPKPARPVSVIDEAERKAREQEAKRAAALRAIQEAELKAKQEREAARRQAEAEAKAARERGPAVAPAAPEAKPAEVKPSVKPSVKPKVDKAAAKKGKEEPASGKRPGLRTRGAVEGDGWRSRKGRHHKGEHEHSQPMPVEAVVREVLVPETISVADLAHKMSVKAAEVIKALMKKIGRAHV